MADTAVDTTSDTTSEHSSPPATDVRPPAQQQKAWHLYISEDLPRTVQESADSAIRSARSLRTTSSTQLRNLQGFMPQIRSKYIAYEDAFVQRVKDEVVIAREHPAAATGLAIAATLVLMRGPRRFLFRHTFGRLQSEEAQFSKAETNVKELSISVDLMKKESKKLLERASLAENEMKRGRYDLRNAGSKIQSIAKSVYKAEAEAADLTEALREIPGREALKLRAEVASLASYLRQQRIAMGKRIMKISDLGIPV